jgi:hypothetical protein
MSRPSGNASKALLNEEKREAAKEALLDAIAGTERGVKASPFDALDIDAAARALERLNPNPAALKSELLNGEWELLYTTSKSILGATRTWPFRPLGPIYQTLDAGRLRANNRETAPFFNAVDADLTPTTANAVNVQFVKFKIFGFIPVTAPESAKGALATTYLDAQMRAGRLLRILSSFPSNLSFFPSIHAANRGPRHSHAEH